MTQLSTISSKERSSATRSVAPQQEAFNTPDAARLTHLKQLEAESIHIIREVAAEFANPVMMYSIGKDSSVMLHLARKAFYPGTPPFPLMHVDTTWKFREMIEFRNRMAEEAGMELIVHTNEEGGPPISTLLIMAAPSTPIS